MDKHVVSLELSKSLKLAGWKKETEFYRTDTALFRKDQVNINLAYPAPLATEILEDVNDTQVHYYLMQRYGIATTQSCLDMMRDVNEVAKMWLYKKENLL